MGVAVAYVAIGPLEELLEQRGCPNLYWALTNLPDRSSRSRRAPQGERVWVLAEFRELKARCAHERRAVSRFIAHIDPILSLDESGKPKQRVRDWLNETKVTRELVDAARRRLIEVGSRKLP